METAWLERERRRGAVRLARCLGRSFRQYRCTVSEAGESENGLSALNSVRTELERRRGLSDTVGGAAAAAHELLAEILFRHQRVVRAAQQADVVHAPVAAEGECVFVVELEPMPLGAASSVVAFERALTGVARPDGATHRRSDNEMQSVWQHARHAVSVAIKNPGFTLAVVSTLGLGIGANTAIFSVVHAVLLRPLAFPEPDRLVTVWADVTARGGPLREWLSFPDFDDLRKANELFEDVAVWGGWTPTLTRVGDAQIITGAVVTHGMFANVLRVAPVIGRGFVAEDDVPDAARVVIVSDGFWRRALGGNASRIGGTIALSGDPYIVVGVMPPGFRPPFMPDADVWTTFRMDADVVSSSRGIFSFRCVGRLREGVTLDGARGRANALAARLTADYPETNTGKGFALFPLRVDLTRDARAPLWVLLGAVGFLLVVACVNVANLLLVRMSARRGELAVRAAIGADARRLGAQLLAESAVLSFAGGALGVLVAYVGADGLVAIAPTGTPRLDEVGVDLSVLVFAVAITALSTFLSGLLPAIHGSRVDLHESLKTRGQGSGTSVGSRIFANALIVGQVSLALILLAGAGLMVRSLRALNAVDLGFDSQNLLTLTLNLPRTRYPDRVAWGAFFENLETRLDALPGVEAVGATSTVPLSGDDGDVMFHIEGRPAPEPGASNALWIRHITPTYFETVGTRIVRGRAFTRGDDGDGPKVTIINETLAKRFFPREDPIGRRINIDRLDQPVWREIVGVAEDIKNFGLQQESRDVGYFPFAQMPTPVMAMTMKTSTDPPALARSARTAIAEMDPTLALSQVTMMDALVRESLASERFVTTLLALFAAVALALAVIGLYGVVSHGVSRREREIGIRIALGAAERDVWRLIVRKSMMLVAAGIGVGIVGGLLVTRAMESFVFGVTTSDPLTFGVSASLLILVAGVASAIPARRALRIEPIAVLNED